MQNVDGGQEVIHSDIHIKTLNAYVLSHLRLPEFIEPNRIMFVCAVTFVKCLIKISYVYVYCICNISYCLT